MLCRICERSSLKCIPGVLGGRVKSAYKVLCSKYNVLLCCGCAEAPYRQISYRPHCRWIGRELCLHFQWEIKSDSHDQSVVRINQCKGHSRPSNLKFIQWPQFCKSGFIPFSLLSCCMSVERNTDCANDVFVCVLLCGLIPQCLQCSFDEKFPRKHEDLLSDTSSF